MTTQEAKPLIDGKETAQIEKAMDMVDISVKIAVAYAHVLRLNFPHKLIFQNRGHHRLKRQHIKMLKQQANIELRQLRFEFELLRSKPIPEYPKGGAPSCFAAPADYLRPYENYLRNNYSITKK